MGTYLADEIETMAQYAACEASRARPRKSEMIGIARQWADVRHLLPQEKRWGDVNDAIEQMDFHGMTHARPVCEAIAKYALWYEGYSFSRGG